MEGKGKGWNFCTLGKPLPLTRRGQGKGCDFIPQGYPDDPCFKGMTGLPAMLVPCVQGLGFPRSVTSRFGNRHLCMPWQTVQSLVLDLSDPKSLGPSPDAADLHPEL